MVTLDVWVAKHPYLQPVADLHALVRATAEEISVPAARIPEWDGYIEEFRAGVPLLSSSYSPIEPGSVERAFLLLAGRLASKALPGALAEEICELNAELRQSPDSPRR